MGPQSVKYIVKNTQCKIHGFVADIVLLTNFLVKNARYALLNNTNYRFPSEKYTVGNNLSLVESTRYSKVISVNYNPQFYQWKIHDGNQCKVHHAFYHSVKYILGISVKCIVWDHFQQKMRAKHLPQKSSVKYIVGHFQNQCKMHGPISLVENTKNMKKISEKNI